MRKRKRLTRKQTLLKIKEIGYHLKGPGILLGCISFLLIVLPLLTAITVSSGVDSLDTGNKWGSNWGADIKIENSAEKPQNRIISHSGDPAPEVVVYRKALGKTITLNLEEYTAGVVAGEMPSTFPTEALKAQAVAARTYAVSKIIRGAANGNSMDHPGSPLCDTTHCQVYRSPEELNKIKSAQWMKTQWPIIQKVVSDTAGQVMYYQGALVEQPLFHSSSGGRTENSEDVFVSALPYLRSVDSPYESEAPYKEESTTIPLSTFVEKVRNAYGASAVNKDAIKVLSRSDGGRVETFQVGNKTVSGREIRDLFGLRSANFTLSFKDGNPVFTTSGYGHGVGMSQWGASGMAKEGYDYFDILTHYYSGVSLQILD